MKPAAQSQTEVVTLSQLADLAGLDPTFFSQHKQELPASVPIRNGKQGRPQASYPLEQLAEFILERTGFLSDIEARLRLALAPSVYRNKERAALKLPGLIRVIEDNDGGFVIVPENLGELAPDLRAKFQALRLHEHDALRTRRCAERQPRRTTTPQESQS